MHDSETLRRSLLLRGRDLRNGRVRRIQWWPGARDAQSGDTRDADAHSVTDTDTDTNVVKAVDGAPRVAPSPRRGKSALLSLGLAAVGSAACSTNAGGSHCLAVMAPEPPQLLYPAPQSSGVPVGIGSLVVATFTGEFSTTLNGGGRSFTTSSFGPPPSPLPSPLATRQPGTSLVSVRIPVLARSTRYGVTFTVPSGEGSCGPPPSYDAGAFTTR